jgi:arabinan endo-1,5-alpha-L-arabinosidase
MMDGGGTLVVAGAGRWAGTGHCSVLQEKDADRLVYHAYDTEWRGIATLRISVLRWDSDGWPNIGLSEKSGQYHPR